MRGRRLANALEKRDAGILLTLQPRRLELVTLLPSHKFRQARSFPPEGESKPRHRRVAHKVHLGMIFITGLVIVLLHVLALLVGSPALRMSLVLHSFVN